MKRWLALTLLLVSPLLWAWGRDGHRIVGLLAQAQLKPAAASEVSRLLAAETEPTLAGVANWADEQRDGDAELARKTGRWHYVNFKGGCDYVPARDCPNGDCIIAAINRHFLILADHSRSDNERRDALKYLVHFIGDVHQPLHAGARPDRGGNDFQLQVRGRASNLHAFWDSEILASPKQDLTQFAAQLALQAPLGKDATRRSDRPAVEWALESCRIAQAPGFYPQTHTLDESYESVHRATAEQRLRQAASRLADMLNYALTTKP